MRGVAWPGLGRWECAEPLLDAAEQALGGEQLGGAHAEALGEARFYLALLEAAAATEACLPSLDARLIEARNLRWAECTLLKVLLNTLDECLQFSLSGS